MIKCTGINCPMQVGSVNPADCKAAESCQYATRPVTRADLIRAMTDEELAVIFGDLSGSGCYGEMLAYLKGDAYI